MNTETASPQEFALQLKAATPHAVVTPALVAINIIVFLAMTAMGVSVLGGRADEYLRYGANFAPLTTGGEWWRLVTCTFVHFGILHLAFNMWALWDGGRLVERLFGNTWFAVLYFFAGVMGSSASMLWNQQAISAGASGAVFGVYGALLAYSAVQRGSIPAEVLNHMRISTGVFVTYSLFYGFAHAGIDNAAHLGGLAGGFAMGLIMARPLAPQIRHTNNSRRALFAVLIAITALPMVALLTPDSARVYRQAIALQKASDAFSTQESRLIAAFQSVVDRTRIAKMSDAAALQELRTEILPAWDQAVADLSRVELDAKAPMRKEYDLLMRYALARRDMIRAVAEYLETSNPENEREIAEQRAQAADALKQYQQLQKK